MSSCEIAFLLKRFNSEILFDQAVRAHKCTIIYSTVILMLHGNNELIMVNLLIQFIMQLLGSDRVKVECRRIEDAFFNMLYSKVCC